MATLVTVSCDRCGSIIPEGADRHTASADVRTAGYDSILRESWELCCECFGLVHRTLLDRCGTASDSWKRPEPQPQGRGALPRQGRGAAGGGAVDGLGGADDEDDDDAAD